MTARDACALNVAHVWRSQCEGACTVSLFRRRVLLLTFVHCEI
jgi:hypothetical protein